MMVERKADNDTHRAADADEQAEDVQARPGRRGARGERLSQRRREARILALETLYETDVAHHHPAEILQRKLEEGRPAEEVAAYARDLLSGVLRHRRELDEIIQSRAPAFPVAQMAAIDRNILRLGLYECLYKRDTVPLKVAINEAIELAKQYGSENSARFVNGVIGRVVGSTPGETGDPSASPDHHPEES